MESGEAKRRRESSPPSHDANKDRPTHYTSISQEVWGRRRLFFCINVFVEADETSSVPPTAGLAIVEAKQAGGYASATEHVMPPRLAGQSSFN